METDDSSLSKSEPASSSTTVTAATPSTATKAKLPSVTLPEVDLYLHLLVLIFALDRQKCQQVNHEFLSYKLNSLSKLEK
jgi:hypothetical protein